MADQKADELAWHGLSVADGVPMGIPLGAARRSLLVPRPPLAGIGSVLVLVLLWVMLAHAASEDRVGPISNRQVAGSNSALA